MVGLSGIGHEMMDLVADPVAPREASVAKFAAAQSKRLPIDLPPELHARIMGHLDMDDIRNTRIAFRAKPSDWPATAWRAEGLKIIKKRREKIEPFISKINNATVGLGHQQVLAALWVVHAVNENLDYLDRPERAKLASFVTKLPNQDFGTALHAIGPGVRHFSVEQQNGLLDRAEQMLQANLSIRGDLTRLLPYFFEKPRQRAFDLCLVQAPPNQLTGALAGFAEQSDLVSKSELNAAVNLVTNPDKSFLKALREHFLAAPDPDESVETYRAMTVETLGRGGALSSKHRDSLLKTAQAFRNDANVSRACAGILNGASLTAIPHWPGLVRLEQLTERADRMTNPWDKARLMAAICSAADKQAPQRAVDALKELMDDPQNEALHEYLFRSLAYLQRSPLAKMLAADRKEVIERVLDYNPVDEDMALARRNAIEKIVGQIDFLSAPKPPDRDLYETAVNLPEEDDSALAICGVAPRIAEQMQGAEPAAHAVLATRASDLVDRALRLGNDAFFYSLRGLKALLPGTSDQQKKNLVEKVLKLPADSEHRLRAIGLLLQSRAALGEDRTNRLLEGTGL